MGVPVMAWINVTGEARTQRIRTCGLALCVCILALQHWMALLPCEGKFQLNPDLL